MPFNNFDEFDEYMLEEFYFEFFNVIIVYDRYVILYGLLITTFVLGLFSLVVTFF